MKDVDLSFIGCGVMGESMIAGLLREKVVEARQISASHPRAARREELSKKYGIEVFENNADAVAGRHAGRVRAVCLCVKPQRLSQVLDDLNSVLNPAQLVISIVAGARIEHLAEALGTAKIVRAMKTKERMCEIFCRRSAASCLSRPRI